MIASCRKEKDMRRLEQAGLEVIQLDVSDSDAIKKAFEILMEKTQGRLDVLINNAGYGQAGALEDLPIAVIKEQFDTNVFGLMELTQRAIPVMRRQGHGRIINISSILGLISLPFRGAYNASKYAVEGLSDTLRLELKPSGIQVISVQPGPIESQFRNTVVDKSLTKVDISASHFKPQYEKMLTTFREQKSKSLFTRDTDAVIKKLIHAIESDRPKSRYPVTFPAHLFIALKRVLGSSLMDKLLLRVSKKELS